MGSIWGRFWRRLGSIWGSKANPKETFSISLGVRVLPGNSAGKGLGIVSGMVWAMLKNGSEINLELLGKCWGFVWEWFGNGCGSYLAIVRDLFGNRLGIARESFRNRWGPIFGKQVNLFGDYFGFSSKIGQELQGYRNLLRNCL